MQPPGGGQPPSERKGKLPPPFGGAARPQTSTGAPPVSPQPQPQAQPQPMPQPQPQPMPQPQPQPQPMPQPQPQPQPQPRPAPQAQPMPAPQPQPQPRPQPAPQAQPMPAPQPQPQPMPAPQPQPQPQAQPMPLPMPRVDAAPTPLPLPAPPLTPMYNPRTSLPGPGYVEFLQISLRRAFRLRIEPDQVTLPERAALTIAGVTDPTQQGVLAWRRSVLFAVAALLIPLIVLGAIELFGKTDVPPALDDAMATLRGLKILVWLTQIGFCALAWVQLRHWTDGRKQGRLLRLGWLALVAVPLVVGLYPLRSTVTIPEGNDAAGLVLGMLFAVHALMMLAPAVLALAPGVVRAALVTKQLFPGQTAPGWLVVAATPVYALLVYVVLIGPYQLTGSGYFVLAIVGLGAAAYFLARTGLELTRPMTRADAVKTLQKPRGSYYAALGLGGLFVVIGLAELVDQLDAKPLAVVNLLATALLHTLLLTLVGTDALLAGLDRARATRAAAGELAAEADQQLETFVAPTRRA